MGEARLMYSSFLPTFSATVFFPFAAFRTCWRVFAPCSPRLSPILPSLFALFYKASVLFSPRTITARASQSHTHTKLLVNLRQCAARLSARFIPLEKSRRSRVSFREVNKLLSATNVRFDRRRYLTI